MRRTYYLLFLKFTLNFIDCLIAKFKIQRKNKVHILYDTVLFGNISQLFVQKLFVKIRKKVCIYIKNLIMQFGCIVLRNFFCKNDDLKIYLIFYPSTCEAIRSDCGELCRNSCFFLRGSNSIKSLTLVSVGLSDYFKSV